MMTDVLYFDRTREIDKKSLLKPYLVVAFLTLSPIISYLSDLGLPSVANYVLIFLILYVPLVIGLLRGTIKISFLCFSVFLLSLIYVLINKHQQLEFEAVYNSVTNGIDARILTFTSSIFAMLFFGINYSDFELKLGIKIAGFVNLAICFVRFFLITIRGTEFLLYGYDMNFGYTLLFSTLVFLALFILERKKLHLFLSISSFLFVLLFGSRGPILCVIIFLALYLVVYLINENNVRKKQKVLFCTIFVLIVLILAYFIIASLDLSRFPRSIQYIFRSGYFSTASDSGRQIIYKDLSHYLEDLPFFGYGLLSDQGFLGVGKYSHNFFIEMTMTFGKIPAIIMLSVFFLITLRIIFYKKTSINKKIFFLVFWSFSIGRLLVSNSFWYETYFWCCLALGIVLLSKRGASINERIK